MAVPRQHVPHRLPFDRTTDNLQRPISINP